MAGTAMGFLFSHSIALFEEHMKRMSMLNILSVHVYSSLYFIHIYVSFFLGFQNSQKGIYVVGYRTLVVLLFKEF